MEPMDSFQDLIRCHLCETSLPSMHCDICHVHLCDACEEKHLSDESKEHYIIPFNMRGLTPKCLKHSSKICELHCNQCDVPICAECVSSTEHEQHEKEKFLKSFSCKKESMQRDLQEFEELIYPNYQEAASNISVQRDDLSKHSQKLKVSLNNRAQTLHREIDTIIQKMQDDIDAMDSEHLAAINKQESAIYRTMKEISQIILEMRRLLNNNDVHFVSKYQSRNHEFKVLPTQIQVTLPSFTPTRNERDQISEQIGSLSKLRITWRPISTAFLDKARILANINIEGDESNTLTSVCCLSDTEFWTCQDDDDMIRLYNLQGKLIKISELNPGTCHRT